MNNALLIKVLEVLEENYNKEYTAKELAKELKMSLQNKELFKITNYLYKFKKIDAKYVHGQYKKYKGAVTELMPKDIFSITDEGVEFLMKLKRLRAEENRSKVIKNLTIVIAFVALAGVILKLRGLIVSPNLWDISIVLFATGLVAFSVYVAFSNMFEVEISE